MALWAIVNAVAFPHRWEVIAGFEQKNNRFMSSNKIALTDVLRMDGVGWGARGNEVKADQLWSAAATTPTVTPAW